MVLRAVVGLGANLGDRLGTMRKAADAVQQRSLTARRSRVYRTAPIGPPQPEFLNAAMLIGYAGTPHDLLGALLAIEAKLGRVRVERWGPRTIDLDILWIDGTWVRTEELVVPHPHLRERAFALAPMLELVPHARDPTSGEPYSVPPGAVRRLRELL
ncbi:MAG TPA: 2-amino-4-hydroxy-6-hydroxymethyldihydropteridine diphosphokinase [Polyangiaceae bacterium]|nr:2-amino-4-hydroxy-6-hydroxymethyldihydropteridine diphosphokinase [Polyangiaceae bacterium]